MGMPTFDFGNLAKIAYSAIVRTVTSPIVMFSTLMIAGGTIFSLLYDFFIGLTIPKIPVTVVMPHEYGGITSYFLYIFNVELLVDILNGFITLINSIISYAPGVILGILVANKVYQVQKHVYKTVKESVSS